MRQRHPLHGRRGRRRRVRAVSHGAVQRRDEDDGQDERADAVTGQLEPGRAHGAQRQWGHVQEGQEAEFRPTISRPLDVVREEVDGSREVHVLPRTDAATGRRDDHRGEAVRGGGCAGGELV